MFKQLLKLFFLILKFLFWAVLKANDSISFALKKLKLVRSFGSFIETGAAILVLTVNKNSDIGKENNSWEGNKIALYVHKVEGNKLKGNGQNSFLIAMNEIIYV